MPRCYTDETNCPQTQVEISTPRFFLTHPSSCIFATLLTRSVSPNRPFPFFSYPLFIRAFFPLRPLCYFFSTRKLSLNTTTISFTIIVLLRYYIFFLHFSHHNYKENSLLASNVSWSAGASNLK